MKLRKVLIYPIQIALGVVSLFFAGLWYRLRESDRKHGVDISHLERWQRWTPPALTFVPAVLLLWLDRFTK